MMKKTHFGPLLLLLLLAVIPRNSCANPLASTDGMKAIEEEMKKGADILTAVMTWLKDNMLSSQFDEIILDLEKRILANRLIYNRQEILKELYESKSRLHQLRSVLNSAASTLKEHCDTMIEIYNDEESDLEIIIFSANTFVSFAEIVNDILRSALIKTIELQDKLSSSKALLNGFNTKQDDEKRETEDKQEAAGDSQVLMTKLHNQKQVHTINTIMLNDDRQYTERVPTPMIIICIFTPGFDCNRITIAITDSNIGAATYKAVTPRMEQDFKTRHTNIQAPTLEAFAPKGELGLKTWNTNILAAALPEAIAKVYTTLLSHVDRVKNYLEKEIKLINIWQIYLKTVILECVDITPQDIKYNIKGIKERLNVLKQACDDYLAHHEKPILF